MRMRMLTEELLLLKAKAHFTFHISHSPSFIDNSQPQCARLQPAKRPNFPNAYLTIYLKYSYLKLLMNIFLLSLRIMNATER